MSLRCAAVLFDLDGVLVESASSVRRSWRRWAEDHGIDLAIVAAAAHGRRTIETMRLLAPEVDAGDAAAELERAQALDVVDVVAVPGARELVAVLAPSEWAVVTSGGRTLALARLRAAGLPPPQVLVTADDVLEGKPSPEGYLLAARRLGVAAAECVVIEDAPVGVRAARAGGMHVIGLAAEPGCDDELCESDFIVRSCSDLQVIHAAEAVAGGRLQVGGVVPGDEPDRHAVIVQGRPVGRCAERVRARLGAARIWHVNSTASGGGVAELLHRSVRRQRLMGLPTGWLVTSAEPRFFELTKRIHHGLHGRGDAEFTDQDRALFDRESARAARLLLDRIRPEDLVVLHDPQTLGTARHLITAGARVVWRCHVGTSSHSDAVARTWELLRPFLEPVWRCVFTLAEYAPPFLDTERVSTMQPSIDPLAAKNREIPAELQAALLAGIGLTTGPKGAAATPDGRPLGATIHDAALPADVPVVAQVSRWDPLKDMAGVLRAFADVVAPRSTTHLVLAGPDPDDIPDDPEGATVFAQVRGLHASLAPPLRARVHLTVLSLRDRRLNALATNAVQRRAAVVAQKSLEEGFGLTATEAMWKHRPVVAGDVGGLAMQIEDGVTGLLVVPTDLRAFGEAVLRLLDDPRYAGELGRAARQRCEERFLIDRELLDHLRIYEALLE